MRQAAPGLRRAVIQSKLQTLLLVVTIVPIPSSWAVVKIHNARWQRAAATTLTKLGATGNYTKADDRQEKTLPRDRDPRQRLTVVFLRG